MNENLNLVELLKDCPVGTKFYSSYLGKDVFFKGIQDDYIECGISTRFDSSFPATILFRKEGSFFKDGGCIIFPSKDQRDWSKWHRPFKDGDILAYTFWRKPTIYIYRENGTHNTSYYAAYSSENNKFYDDGTGALASNRDDLRFATENEKKKLFDVIRENGYQWNPETKTLEKLKKEKFDPKTLQPFDKVLVSCNDEWFCDFFSHYDDAVVKFNCICTGGCPYECCIPYNDDTKHLIGKTIEEAPEFYRYWEE